MSFPECGILLSLTFLKNLHMLSIHLEARPEAYKFQMRKSGRVSGGGQSPHQLLLWSCLSYLTSLGS